MGLIAATRKRRSPKLEEVAAGSRRRRQDALQARLDPRHRKVVDDWRKRKGAG